MRFSEIILEDGNYNELSDAGELYKPGRTQIWYSRPQYTRALSSGYHHYIEKAPFFDPDNISNSHILLGTLAEEDPYRVLDLMQGPVWSPAGEGANLISRNGLNHTGIFVGDIIATPDYKLLVDVEGFIDLLTGEPYTDESDSEVDGEAGDEEGVEDED